MPKTQLLNMLLLLLESAYDCEYEYILIWSIPKHIPCIAVPGDCGGSSLSGEAVCNLSVRAAHCTVLQWPWVHLCSSLELGRMCIIKGASYSFSFYFFSSGLLTMQCYVDGSLRSLVKCMQN